MSHPFLLSWCGASLIRYGLRKNDRIVILILRTQVNVKLFKKNSIFIDNHYHFKHNRINRKDRFWEDSLWMTL
jgi:hypothetical protein